MWNLLRMHGAGVDTMVGAYLPIRLEALRIECDRHPAGEELLWRVCVIDEVFLEERSKGKSREEKKKQTKKI